MSQINTPPQSPDLNPIEHLWDLLELKIRQHNISSNAEEYAEETTKLVHSMPKRLQKVLGRRGYPTSY
ncbi:hypothetical protein TNCV_3217121 [Trichonephila clavipes]|nr:hypothetical protein TNCV_3217121 [Trichonephila clavipes]